jgi:hypothetical protein
MRWPLGRYPTIFRKVSSDRTDELGSLPHQQVPGSKHQTRSLLLFTLHGNEPHARPPRSFADRLGVDRVVLLPLYKRLYISGRDQPNLMAKLRELSGPVMGSATCL